MKRINYKGRCEKRKASKCTEVCRTYSKIQSAYVDVLEQDESIICHHENHDYKNREKQQTMR